MMTVVKMVAVDMDGTFLDDKKQFSHLLSGDETARH